MVVAPPTTERRFTFWALMASGALIAALLLPLWQPLLLAAVITAGLNGIQEKLVRTFRGRRWLAATVMTVGTNVLILAPIALLVAIAISQADDALYVVRGFIDEGKYKDVLMKLPEPVASRLLDYTVTLPKDIGQTLGASGSLARRAMGGLSVLGAFVTQYALMTVAMFFLFADAPGLRRWANANVPLRSDRTRQVFVRFRQSARVVLGGNLLTALAQATVATIGYFIAHVPQAFFFGLLTFFTSFFPAIGTALVALPLALLLYAMGHLYSALFLAAWATLVVGVVDNVVRPLLTKGKEQLHGAVVFFSLLGGVALFGAIGLVAGPLALSLFFTLLQLWKQETAESETAESS